ncbi:MAG: substrate-binding domain-containing protein [Candidatus Omnitrophota bacterium]
MKRRASVWVITCVILVLARVSAAQEAIVIAGTGDSQQLLRVLAGEFEKIRPGLQVVIPESIGSSGGVRAVAEGKCDLARVGRPLKEKEKAYNLNYKVFAHSPAVFVASADVSAIDNVTTQQVTDIFSGKITTWKELGGRRSENLCGAARSRGFAAQLD